MPLIDRRRPRPAPSPPRTPTTTDIEGLLEWVAAEVRAERRYTWYVARCPSRFISYCRPSEN